MADQHIDIARMVMQAQYEMQLEREASSVQGGELSDMEREDYQKRINDLLNAVTTLLDANNAMGEKLQRLEKIADAYEDLKAENEKLKGELAMRKRGHYGKGSEKPKDDSSSDEKTKDDDENDYIENGCKRDVPPVEDPEDEERSPSEPPVKKERDLSNRPEHYEKGHAVAAAWLTFVESCKLQKKAALEVFNGYFQRIAQGRRDYDLITEEVLC